MADTVTVTGDERAVRRLHAIGRQAHQQRRVMAEQADRTARQITGIPVDTGTLERSIEVLSATDTGFTVGTSVPYARYVFNGTKYMDAQPPKIPRDIAQQTARAIVDDLERAS